MRVYPNAWVLPGGHIDLGETLEECVIREVHEETGVQINIDETDEGGQPTKFSYRGRPVEVSPFFSFESSIPKFKDGRLLTKESPVGHFILFFHVKLSTPSEDIEVKL